MHSLEDDGFTVLKSCCEKGFVTWNVANEPCEFTFIIRGLFLAEVAVAAAAFFCLLTPTTFPEVKQKFLTFSEWCSSSRRTVDSCCMTAFFCLHLEVLNWQTSKHKWATISILDVTLGSQLSRPFQKVQQHRLALKKWCGQSILLACYLGIAQEEL